MTRIRINQDTEVEIIKEGEDVTKPLGYIKWSNGKAKENGINVIWGGRGEVGTFIPEKLLRRFLKEFEKHDTDNNS